MIWLLRLIQRNKMEAELEKELRFHIDQRTAELIERGAAPDSARRQALIEFGSAEAAKEECRDARCTRCVEDFFRDLRYAFRTLRQKPGCAAVALITLTLGIGTTSLMFTVVNGVLLKPLPYAEPNRLLNLQERTDKATQYGNLWAFAYPNYLDLKQESRTLDFIAITFNGGTVSYSGQSEYGDGFEISDDALSILGVNVIRGRAFTAADNHIGAAPVAIISYGLWQRFFSGQNSAIGQQITFDGKPYQVIGIAPAGFHLEGNTGLLGGDPDILLPIGQDTAPFFQRRDRHGVQVWTHVRPGVTLAQVRAEIDAIGRQLSQQYPASNQGRTFVADPLQPNVDGVRSTLWLLLGAVSLILLIACVNIASLLLARAVSRDRELAIRVALGAGRSQVVRQCLTESAVLAFGGAMLGVAVALLGLRPFLAVWPGGLPHADRVQ